MIEARGHIQAWYAARDTGAERVGSGGSRRNLGSVGAALWPWPVKARDKQGKTFDPWLDERNGMAQCSRSI